ncbi:hypothetical protein Dgeo_3054 (plasmid) [Deinococcus geothermalis DSM 11300]|uniref:Uncharacterized protein n=1 Tax=Deinococcus geothermalis (strain DSM 11300 / CIP 105573 / AG-3a) TaxID=319795 RepID=A8ZRI6_DEIGD|nr:hypothetical protein [Deinococcus geothermalis]ABW35095.1 hypothetical protein Dgeo_3054 [Deinococcus geothermalis DSM 11300]
MPLDPQKRNAVAALIEEGMAQVQQGETFAKAAQDPLDQDFEGLDEARASSDAAHEEDQDDSDGADNTDAADADDEDEADGDDDDSDDDEDDADDAPGEGRLSKADGDWVDAMPLLEAIDRKYDLILERLGGMNLLYEEVQGIKGQVGTLAKAVQSSAQGTLTLAKAIAPHADAPLPPKSKRVAVPTAIMSKADADESPAVFFAKAEQALTAGRIGVSDLALLNGTVNTRGLAGARAALPQLFALVEAK